MSKKGSHGDNGRVFVMDSHRQRSFDFIKGDDYSVELVSETVDGFGLFRRKEAHGGYSYWTDAIPPGVMVYDEGVTNVLHVFEAMNHLGIGKEMWKHLGEVYGYKD